MPLNIDLKKILLHMFNFVLLFGIAYFLLYSPIKKFMDKRAAEYKEMDDEAKKALEDAEATKKDGFPPSFYKFVYLAHSAVHLFYALRGQISCKVNYGFVPRSLIVGDVFGTAGARSYAVAHGLSS